MKFIHFLHVQCRLFCILINSHENQFEISRNLWNFHKHLGCFQAFIDTLIKISQESFAKRNEEESVEKEVFYSSEFLFGWEKFIEAKVL